MSLILSIALVVASIAWFAVFAHGMARLLLKGQFVSMALAIIIQPLALFGFFGGGYSDSPWSDGYRIVGFWGRVRRPADSLPEDSNTQD